MRNDFLRKASQIIIIERDYQVKNKKNLGYFLTIKVSLQLLQLTRMLKHHLSLLLSLVVQDLLFD